MAEHRFIELRDALLKAGVAQRNARRAMTEIESHFNQLVDEGVLRGASAHAARLDAHTLLGTNETLIQHYAAQPELLALSSRWPAIGFILIPLLSYLAVCATTMILVILIIEAMSTYLHRIQLAPRLTHLINASANVLFLWIFPALIAVAFGVLARRRNIAPRWPVAGVIFVSGLAALINLSVTVTGGASPGSAGAGIGISLDSLAAQTIHAASVATIAMTSLWIAARQFGRDVVVQ